LLVSEKKQQRRDQELDPQKRRTQDLGYVVELKGKRRISAIQLVRQRCREAKGKSTAHKWEIRKQDWEEKDGMGGKPTNGGPYPERYAS